MPPVTQRHVLSYLVVLVVVPVLAALGQQITLGNVPIPSGWAWIIPLLLVGITGLTALLPKLASEMSAAPAPVAPLVVSPPPVPPTAHEPPPASGSVSV